MINGKKIILQNFKRFKPIFGALWHVKLIFQKIIKHPLCFSQLENNLPGIGLNPDTSPPTFSASPSYSSLKGWKGCGLQTINGRWGDTKITINTIWGQFFNWMHWFYCSWIFYSHWFYKRFWHFSYNIVVSFFENDIIVRWKIKIKNTYTQLLILQFNMQRFYKTIFLLTYII